MRNEDLTRDEMLVRLVSKLVFLLRERSSRVLASGAFCCEARLRLTVEIVRLVAAFRDSLDRDPTCCGVPFGIGYGCYLKEYIVIIRNVCNVEKTLQISLTFRGRPTLFRTTGGSRLV